MLSSSEPRPLLSTRRFSIIVSAWLVLLSSGECPAQTVAVPAVYQDLYTQLNGEVADFQGKVNDLWNGSKYPVKFSGQLTAANSNNGPGLLQPSSFTLIQSEIQYLKSIGVKAISVEVSFPMLYQPFFDAIGQPSYQSQFATLYANVASAIRAQGLQVIVESQSLIPTGLQSVWGTGLAEVLQRFQRVSGLRQRSRAGGRRGGKYHASGLLCPPGGARHRVVSVRTGTGGHRRGLHHLAQRQHRRCPAGGCGGHADRGGVRLVAASVPVVRQQLYTAGMRPDHQRSGRSQPCVSAPLDFLDLHLYPITENTTFCSSPPNPQPCTSPNFLQNALAIVSTANAARMPISISQTWLRKTRNSEWLQISGDIDEAREAYSFWAPLDAAFLQAVYGLAHYAHMPFVVPFNTPNFAAYLTWTGGSVCTIPACTALQGEGGGNTPAQVYSAAQSAAIAAIPSFTYSSVGTAYRNLIQDFTVSLATSNETEVFAPGAIVSAFGTNLAAVTATASLPLPNLAGTTVAVTDSAGVSLPALIFYVSSSQVNYEIPETASTGLAMVTIASQGGSSQSAVIQIGTLSPGLFQLNASGLAAAWVLPVLAGVQQPLQSVYQLDASNSVVALPINLGPAAEQIYLELYGTGIRNAKRVVVMVGGLSTPVLFARPAPDFVGLDQVNIGPLPPALAGRGSVNIILTADDQPANTVNLTIQ